MFGWLVRGKWQVAGSMWLVLGKLGEVCSLKTQRSRDTEFHLFFSAPLYLCVSALKLALRTRSCFIHSIYAILFEWGLCLVDWLRQDWAKPPA